MTSMSNLHLSTKLIIIIGMASRGCAAPVSQPQGAHEERRLHRPRPPPGDGPEEPEEPITTDGIVGRCGRDSEVLSTGRYPDCIARCENDPDCHALAWNIRDEQCTLHPKCVDPNDNPDFRKIIFPKELSCPEDWKVIICPVMSALCRNGDLVPDDDGFVTKQQTFDALLRVGISKQVATDTTDGNFDHLTLDPPRLNIFEMNVVDAHNSTPAGDQTKIATEHFRSTGIRDADKPQEDLFRIFASKTDSFDRWTSAELIEAIGQFDHEQNSDVLTNDVFEPARPMGCGPADSGLPQCDSALYGSITNLLKEFGTPSGEAAQMVKTDMRKLWMEAQYPPDFAARSPRSCYDATAAAEHGGCGLCFDEAVSVGDFNPGIVGVPFEVQRYCRCLLIHAEAAKDPFTAFCLTAGM